MHFVHGERALERLVCAAVFQPGVVVPAETRGIVDDRGGVGAALRGEGKRVGLVDGRAAVLRDDAVFVELAVVQAGDKKLPDAGAFDAAHRVDAAVPAVEIADEADLAGVRRPDGEADAVETVDENEVRAEVAVKVGGRIDGGCGGGVGRIAHGRREGGEVVGVEAGGQAVGRGVGVRVAGGVGDGKLVGEGLRLAWENGFEDAVGVDALHRDFEGALGDGRGGVAAGGRGEPGAAALGGRLGVADESDLSGVGLERADGEGGLALGLGRGGRKRDGVRAVELLGRDVVEGVALADEVGGALDGGLQAGKGEGGIGFQELVKRGGFCEALQDFADEAPGGLENWLAQFDRRIDDDALLRGRPVFVGWGFLRGHVPGFILSVRV
jgi:hypothetical protein